MNHELLDMPSSVADPNGWFIEKGWSDGLPMVPPTERLVAAMLEYAESSSDEVVAVLPPLFGEATWHLIAVNAVMAGCRPEYLPVLAAAVRAVAEPRFNLLALQATTHPCAPLVIVNGPIRKDLEINSGTGLFGPGWRANATIGRALRLILMNVGGARPGTMDMSTMGHPGNFSYCIAENEEESPWAPFHLERGFKESDSTVTVVPGEAPHNINDHNSRDGEGILRGIAGSMGQMGSNNNWHDADPLLVLGPEHAASIARSGYQKSDVQEYVAEHAVTPMDRWSVDQQVAEFRKKSPDLYSDADETSTLIPIIRRPESLLVIVAGGPGKHSMHVPTVGVCRSVTKLIVNP